MKIVISLSLIMVSLSALAQRDSVNMQHQPAAPQGQYGTQRAPDLSETVKEDRVEVDKNQLPPKMKDELANNAVYDGWENGNVFFERNTEQYLVHVVKDNTTHTFRFDKDGNRIKTDAPIDTSETRQ